MERCAACGAEFGCGNVEGKASCWCAELPPVMPAMGDACLCPKCLKAEIKRRVGDCLDCAHAKLLKTKGGGPIYLCGRSESEPSYERYPSLPCLGCPGLTARFA